MEGTTLFPLLIAFLRDTYLGSFLLFIAHEASKIKYRKSQRLARYAGRECNQLMPHHEALGSFDDAGRYELKKILFNY